MSTMELSRGMPGQDRLYNTSGLFARVPSRHFGDRITNTLVEKQPQVDTFLGAFLEFLSQHQEHIDSRIGGYSMYDKKVIGMLQDARDKQSIQGGKKNIPLLLSSKEQVLEFAYSANKGHFWDGNDHIKSHVHVTWDGKTDWPVNIFIEGTFGNVSRSGLNFIFFPVKPENLEEALLPVSYPYLLKRAGATVWYGPHDEIHTERVSTENEKIIDHFKPLDVDFDLNSLPLCVYGTRVHTASVNQIHFPPPRGDSGSVRFGDQASKSAVTIFSL